jgi:chemotaxis protein CheD
MALEETMVRMGELAASRTPGHVLVAMGLGSCIGLALLDRRRRTAGLAHVVLPESTGGGSGENLLRFADHAVPALVERLIALGARRSALEAVLVGGASMFAASPGLEVGSRNEAAVRRALAALRIPILAAATGGSRGRTVRVDVATTAVVVREAGGPTGELVAPSAALEPRYEMEVA